MDHGENQSSPKTLTNSEHKIISSNEDAITSSESEKNELERYFVKPDKMVQNQDVYTSDDAGNMFLGSDRYILGESEQETLQSTENNDNFSNMNISTENAASDSAPDSCFHPQQQESHLDISHSSSHLFHPSYVSVDKDEEVGSYSLTSIFGAESKANKILITKSKIYVYDETFTSTLQRQNDVLSSTVFTDSSTEEFRTAINTSNRYIPINSDVCMPESFEAVEGGIQLDPTNMTAGTTGSSGISSGQGDADVQDIFQRAEEPQNEISPVAEASDDDRSNRICNSGAPVDPINDMNSVVGSSSMSDEVQWHIVDGRFVCAICGKNFGKITSIVNHYRSHTVVKKLFSCGMCERRFSRSKCRDRHLLTHKGMAPFACSTCAKTFNRSRTLTRHLRTHSSPFACDQCGERYGKEKHLIMHRRTHTGENLNTCSICKIAFSHRSGRNKHYKTVHHINRK